MALVAGDLHVLEPERVDVADGRIQVQARKGQRIAAELQRGLVEVVE